MLTNSELVIGKNSELERQECPNCSAEFYFKVISRNRTEHKVFVKLSQVIYHGMRFVYEILTSQVTP